MAKTYGLGLEAALDVVGGKWKCLILWTLRGQPRRFGALKREVAGISEKMLIENLKEMELDGLILRHDFREVPPRVEYSLTEFGESLSGALIPLCDWGNIHRERIEARKQECKKHQDNLLTFPAPSQNKPGSSRVE